MLITVADRSHLIPARCVENFDKLDTIFPEKGLHIFMNFPGGSGTRVGGSLRKRQGANRSLDYIFLERNLDKVSGDRSLPAYLSETDEAVMRGGDQAG